LHSVRAGKRKPYDHQLPTIEEEALAGPDGPLPRKLTPEWIAVNLMDITAHLMAAIDKAAGPLDRLADAAEDATAHVVHVGTFLRKPITIVVAMLLLLSVGFGTYEIVSGRHNQSASISALNPAEIRLGGVAYPINRKLFEDRLSSAQPESIRKYFVEIGGRNFPVKQAVSVGFGAPRASFGSDAAIHALTKLGYRTQESAQ
jgi:hypothetical protein